MLLTSGRSLLSTWPLILVSPRLVSCVPWAFARLACSAHGRMRPLKELNRTLLSAPRLYKRRGLHSRRKHPEWSKNTFLRSKRAISTGLPGCNRQVVEVLRVFNDHPADIIASSSWMGTENFVARKRFSAEGSPPNNSLKVSVSIGMVTDARLTMLVVGGFFMFSFSATNTAKVCSKPGVPWWCVVNTCFRCSFASVSSTQLSYLFP